MEFRIKGETKAIYTEYTDKKPLTNHPEHLSNTIKHLEPISNCIAMLWQPLTTLKHCGIEFCMDNYHRKSKNLVHPVHFFFCANWLVALEAFQIQALTFDHKMLPVIQ